MNLFDAVREAIDDDDLEELKALACYMVNRLEKQHDESIELLRESGHDVEFVKRMLSQGFSSDEVFRMSNERRATQLD